MSTLFLICGLPGSGKTTLAKRLEHQRHALRLSPDEWMEPLLGEDVHNRARLDSFRDPVEAVQWSVARRVLALGRDVILENGFWSLRERDEYRMRGASIGASVQLLFLDVPLDVLRSRMAKRNAESPRWFQVQESELELWSSWFEPPTADEWKKNS